MEKMPEEKLLTSADICKTDATPSTDFASEQALDNHMSIHLDIKCKIDRDAESQLTFHSEIQTP